MIIKIQVARKEEKTTSAKKMKVILNCELKMNISANIVFSYWRVLAQDPIKQDFKINRRLKKKSLDAHPLVLNLFLSYTCKGNFIIERIFFNSYGFHVARNGILTGRLPIMLRGQQQGDLWKPSEYREIAHYLESKMPLVVGWTSIYRCQSITDGTST